jgi:glycosyltransferase involved in cell wall biosynthesis
MRILVLTNLYPPHYLGGYELICHMVAGALRARGHEVAILTSNHGVPGASGEEPAVERSLRIHGFYGHPWLGIAKLAQLEKHNNRTLRAAIDRFRPDVVSAWNMGGLSKSMVLTLQELGIPSVFYVSDHWIARGFESDVWLSWWSRRGPAQAAARALGLNKAARQWAPIARKDEVRFQRLCFCSKAMRKITAGAGFEVMHGAVIYPPVDVQRFDAQPRPAATPIRKLLWVGRLAEDKGVMTALKAMKAVAGRFDGGLHIFGRGDADYVAGLKRFVQEHALPVTFGSAGMADMPRIYREHDALLFTSEWAEPFALTPLEAMASGTPVIGTLTGGSREIFRHGDNALTYSAGNADELAERILELSSQDKLRCAMASAGREEVRAQYALPVMAAQYEQYLAESVRQWRRL